MLSEFLSNFIWNLLTRIEKDSRGCQCQSKHSKELQWECTFGSFKFYLKSFQEFLAEEHHTFHYISNQIFESIQIFDAWNLSFKIFFKMFYWSVQRWRLINCMKCSFFQQKLSTHFKNYNFWKLKTYKNMFTTKTKFINFLLFTTKSYKRKLVIWTSKDFLTINSYNRKDKY